MNYEEAKEKLARYGQEHVLRYYDELTDEEKAALITQIDETDFSLLHNAKDHSDAQVRGVIEPLGAMEIPEIEARRDEFEAAGLEAIRAGKVAAVVLAGGMGTRLGSDDPKCMYDIGITHPVYIIERQIRNLLDVVEKAGCMIPYFVMTSDKNDTATRNFLKEHDYFGYDPDYVWFFKQEMAPACDYEGKVYMEEKGKIATSPNGNGGWFASMERTGILDVIHEKGIEWLNAYSVDNVLQRMADPVFIGAVLVTGRACGGKVVKKVVPEEAVGAMCLEDGRPSIVEYYDMTPELLAAKDDRGEPAYNFGVILNYLFRVSDLEDVVKNRLPLHIVNKKIPYIDENGEPVKPDKPNGYKFETLILDMIHEMSSCVPFEVVREKEFAPIKNKTGVDSVESARELCRLNGIEL